jgi:hypothetical protein
MASSFPSEESLHVAVPYPIQEGLILLNNHPLTITAIDESTESSSYSHVQASKKQTSILRYLQNHYVSRDNLFSTRDSENDKELMYVESTRRLQNFNELNELLKSVTIILPEFSFSAGTLLFVEAKVTATYTKCVDISIRDLQILYERVSNTRVTLDVLVEGLGFDCEIFWEYVSSCI